MRRSACVDNNEQIIIAALRRVGCVCSRVCGRGPDENSGFPDLVVSYQKGSRRETVLLEIKDGTKPPSQRKLRANQEEFRARWKGRIFVVTSVEEALAAVEIETEK